MRPFFFALARVAFIAATIAPAAAQGDPAVYGAAPAVSEVQISPDGSSVAMLRSMDDTMSVVFYDLANPDAKPAGIQVGGGKARDIVWADNDHILVLASQTGRMQVTTGLETIEFFRWFSVSKSKMKSVVLFGNEGNLYISSAGTLISTLPDDPDFAMFARYNTQKAGGASYDLLRGNLKSGDTKLAAAGRSNTYDWLVMPSGEPLARIDYDSARKESILNLSDNGASAFHEVRTYEDAPGSVGGVSFYGLTPDGAGLVVATRNARGLRSLAKVDKTTGEIGETLFSSPEYDIDGAVYDYEKATATGARYTDDLPRTLHFDPVEQKIQDQLVKALPGAAPMIVSKSADRMKMIVRAIYTDHPDQYFLFDRATKALSMI
ncbi:MAG: LpqB family beta-propeller domain-containing protein, partial [Pseudomonadota bacterium]